MQQGTKSDAHGSLLQSFRNMDITTGPAGTPRPTANTGDQQRRRSLAYPIIDSSQPCYVYVSAVVAIKLSMARLNMHVIGSALCCSSLPRLCIAS